MADSVQSVSTQNDVSEIEILPAIADSTSVSQAREFFAVCEQEGTPIPFSLVNLFLDETAEEGMGVSFSTRGMQKLNGTDVIFYSIFRAAGPGVTEYLAATFSKDGTRQSIITLGEEIPYGGPMGTDGKETNYDITNGIIHVENVTVSWDEEKEQDVTTNEEHYFAPDGQGILVERDDVGRSYLMASERILEPEELSNYDSDDLKWMRNEIYAAHGYIFKSKEMKDHFGGVPWYQPLYENVDHLLSDIEKENIRRIRQAEKQ